MEYKFEIITALLGYSVYVLYSRSFVSLLPLPFLLYFIVYAVFKDKNCSHKLYFPVIFALFISESLLIIYIYQFSFVLLKNSLDFGMFLVSLAVLIILVFINVHYIFTGRYKEFPWVKNS